MLKQIFKNSIIYNFMTTKNIFKIVGVLVFAIVAWVMVDSMVVSVNASEIVVTRDPLDGDMHIFNTAGTKSQNFGRIDARYPKQYTYTFDIPDDRKQELSYDSVWTNPEVAQYGLKIMFNDNGEAYLFGSLPTYFPVSEINVLDIHANFGTFENVNDNLIRRQLNSAIFNVGPLMSSKESSAERRSDLLGYIEDIVKNGAYQMVQYERKDVDPISRDTIIVRYAERFKDVSSPGGYKRQSQSELATYGFNVGTPVISRIVYEPAVKKQIQRQQELTMNIQTSKAQALEAQQNEKTALSQKAASIAAIETKYESEKRQATIIAEKQRDVAEISAKEEEYKKRAMILKGEGEAEYKKLTFLANGALELKLDALVQIQKAAYEAWGKNGASIVPVWFSGSGGGSNNSDALNQFLQTMTAANAKQLGLDMDISKR